MILAIKQTQIVSVMTYIHEAERNNTIKINAYYLIASV